MLRFLKNEFIFRKVKINWKKKKKMENKNKENVYWPWPNSARPPRRSRSSRTARISVGQLNK
jgi:hypothetical protein